MQKEKREQREGKKNNTAKNSGFGGNQAWKEALTPTSKSQADMQTFGSSPRTH